MKPRRPAWAASYPPGTPWRITLPQATLPQLVAQIVQAHPNRIAVDFLGKTLTYAAFWQKVRQAAAGFRKMGVVPGTRVALFLPNCPEYVIAYHAVLMLEGVVVNLNPLLSGPEVAAMLKNAGVSILVTTNVTRLWTQLKEARRHVKIPRVVVIDFAQSLPLILGLLVRVLPGKLAKPGYTRTVRRWAGLFTHGMVGTLPTNPEALALLQFTGGTTGTPKAAMLSHRNLIANLTQIKLWLGNPAKGGERILGLLPLCHVFAMTAIMNLALATGGAMVLLPQLDHRQLRNTIRRTRPTILPGVPTLFQLLATNPRFKADDFQGLRYAVSGGASLSPAIRKAFTGKTKARLIEGYGLTEAAPVVACQPRHRAAPVTAAGLPLPGTTVSIRGLLTGRPQPTGKKGEVWVKGPQVMLGYWQNPEETKHARHQGWLKTGDIGHLDRHGYLHLTDRVKDLILTHGYNVYPRQIEDVIRKHPAVSGVTVLARPHPHKGQVPHAFVALHNNKSLSEADLMTFLKPRLGPLSLPHGITLLPSLPLTLLGKPDRKALARRLEDILKNESAAR